MARLLRSVRTTGSKMPARLRAHNTTLVAAGVAFYAFLAFIPALIAFVSVYGLVADPADVKRQVDDVASALPDEVQRFLTFQLESIAKASSGTVSVTLAIAVAIALWSASGGMAALTTGLNVAAESDEPRRMVAKRGKAIALTLGTIAFLTVVMFLITALPSVVSEAGDVGRTSMEILRWPILAVVIVVGIGLLYRFATPARPRAWLGFITPGAVVATVGWLVVSAGFGLYAGNLASYSKTYGSLASIVVLLVWIWLSALLVLIGAEYDAASGTTRSTR